MATDRIVVFVAYDGMTGLELGIVSEALGVRPRDYRGRWYDFRVAAESTVPLRNGATLRPEHGLPAITTADTVIVPGVPDVHDGPSPELVAALREAHRNGARLVSICIGAFALAGAGLLTGRRVTTHWQYADLLRQRYPNVEVDPDVLYVDDGDVLTGAGHTAGLDVCLHLIRTDFGATLANAVARRMVAPPHRDGGQAQFIEAAVTPSADDDRIGRSMVWATENLGAPITVTDLARKAGMPTRTYLRRFTRSTGTSPGRWLIAQRVQSSLPLLETTDVPIERVAAAVGFERPVTFRHHFARVMHTSPSAYRRAFRASSSASDTA